MSIAVVIASDDVEIGKTTVALVIARALRDAGFTDVDLVCSDINADSLDDDALGVAVASVADVNISVYDQDADMAEVGL